MRGLPVDHEKILVPDFYLKSRKTLQIKSHDRNDEKIIFLWFQALKSDVKPYSKRLRNLIKANRVLPKFLKSGVIRGAFWRKMEKIRKFNFDFFNKIGYYL